jgi:ferredoxin-fold anticodon binding domain-containing protein
MPQEKSAFSTIQEEVLIPAFEAIVALLKEKGVEATLGSTNDSITVKFVGKNGKECEYSCRIYAGVVPRIYEHYVKPTSNHGESRIDTSVVFAKDVNPETIVRAFKSHFSFQI